MTYLLDSNILITAHRFYYAFDICPGFWRQVIAHHESGSLYSIDRVKTELEEQGDELAEWIDQQLSDSFFLSTDEPGTIKSYGECQV